jgi:tetratricopeptide (TPR) repeat protein
VAAEKRQAELREQAERGLALEKKMREMQPITDKLTEAGRLLSHGEFAKAEELMSQITVDIPQSSIIYNALGDVRCWRGEYAAAITNFTRSTVVDPTNYLAYQSLAPLFLQTGRIDDYQRLRQAILGQFGSTHVPVVAAAMAKACLLTPAATNDLEPVIKLAQVSFAAAPDQVSSSDIDFLKGLAEYRQHHPAAAAESLSRAAANRDDPSRAVEAFAVLAMTQQQLGKSAEARDSLAKGLQLIPQKAPEAGIQGWLSPLTARLLVQEAKLLIEGSATTAAQVK